MERRHGRACKIRARVDALAQGPTHELAAVEVQNGGQIKPALLGLNIGDVRHPELIGRIPLAASARRSGAIRLAVIAVGSYGR